METSVGSPPHSPTLDQQRDALQKGLGRAVMWASLGHLDDAPLLDACLHDKRYDTQSEDERTDWLWNIMSLAGATERFRDEILEALNALKDERAASQLCELGRLYAESGDEQFRARLYEIVETKPIEDSPWLGEMDIIELDGESAFLFGVRTHGERLEKVEGYWDDGTLAELAADQWGEERVQALLSSSADIGIKRYFDNWRAQKQKTTSEPTPAIGSVKEQTRAITAEEIVESARRGDSIDAYAQWRRFTRWGRHASDESLRTAFAAACQTSSPHVATALLRVFADRALPTFDHRLIDLCAHETEELRDAAITALTMNSHADVREFALKLLANGSASDAMRLFTRNFMSGDEDRIIEAIALPQDPDQLHSLLMDIHEVLSSNEESDCSRLGVLIYSATPCQVCRRHAVDLLTGDQAAPAWLIEECRHDSDKVCQELGFEALVSKYTVR
jgi:hypothetical protein